jgi:hypothetical protein
MRGLYFIPHSLVAPHKEGPADMISIHCWSFFAFVYISERCMFFIDFYVLTLPRSSRARHDLRLEKSVPAASISSSVIAI